MANRALCSLCLLLALLLPLEGNVEALSSCTPQQINMPFVPHFHSRPNNGPPAWTQALKREKTEIHLLHFHSE